MLKNFLTGAALATSLAIAGPALAGVTYTSEIEHDDTDLTVDGSFGQVIIEEVNANQLKLTVNLFAPQKLIVDTGTHYAFTFNLADDGASQIDILNPAGGGSFAYQGAGTYDNPPFVNFTHAFSCCGQGASNGEPPPLVFTITNTNGITFAGTNAVFGLDGKLLVAGTVGNRLVSTLDTFKTKECKPKDGPNCVPTQELQQPGGWWFSVDTADASGNTGAKAARDAFRVQTVVPEPGTWALMILGFGAAGAMLRRRKMAIA